MVKEAKKVVGNLAKVMKSNRILMIVCVFVVMGLAVALIQFLQDKTLERFANATAYTIAEESPGELELAVHGNRHQSCKHVNNEGIHHTCGHAHTSNAAKKAAEDGLVNESNATANVAFNVNEETGELSAV